MTIVQDQRDTDDRSPGLSSGRNWSDIPADDTPLTWTLDPEGGLVQGPLDLDFLRGRKLALVLEEGQLALLTRDDAVQQELFQAPS